MGLKDKLHKKLLPFNYVKEKLSRYGFEKLGNYTFDDVFLMGFPKSGNTLLQFLIAYLVGGLPKNTSLSLINSVVTEIYTNPYYFRLNERHYFKGHELPKKEYRKVIYIVRDGRDVILSYYKMLVNLGHSVKLDEMYLTGGKSFVGTWNNHVLQWSKNPYGADILFVKFEDLISNKLSEIDRIANFLDIKDFDPEYIVEASSVQNMKLQENGFSWKRSKSKLNWNEEGEFVRKGNAKSYISERVSEDLISEFERISYSGLSKFNYI